MYFNTTDILNSTILGVPVKDINNQINIVVDEILKEKGN